MANKDTTMLPPFRVRRILPLDVTVPSFAHPQLNVPTTLTRQSPLATAGTDTAPIRSSSADSKYVDGVILMNKDEYTELLKTQPQAALRYVDEDDGEVIHVSSNA